MIGIDIAERSLKLVQLSNHSSHKFLAHAAAELTLGVIEKGIIVQPDAMRTAIQQMLKECRLGTTVRDGVIASIPEARSFLRVLEIPLMDESEIEEAVKWEVAQHIPFGIDNVYIDWQDVRGGHTAATGRREVLVGAAEKKVVDVLLSVLQSLGLDVAALELESQAIVRALISPELQRHAGLLIVDLGGSATNVVIYDHGTIRFTASLQRGSDHLVTVLPADALAALNAAQASGDGINPALAEKLQAVLEELVIEVRGIVEFYNGLDAEHEVREILLTGGGSNLPGLDRAFLRHFDKVHIQRGNPWVNVLPAGQGTQPPLNLYQSVRYSTALGLALRHAIL